MTFSRATSGLRGEKTKDSRLIHKPEERISAKMPKMVEEEERPDKFLSETHEIEWEIEDCRRKLIMTITGEEIIAEMEKYEPEYSDDFVFKNPVNYGARVSAVKIKIYNATGIMP